MAAEPVESPDLASLLSWLRQQWWLIAGGVVLGVAAGVAAFVLLPKAYESTTAVLVSPLSTSGTAGSSPSLNMDTELQLVQSATVGERAATELGRPDAGGAVLARLSLFVPPNSTVIEITYEGTTSESARAGAEAVADAYLGAREDAALAVVDQQIAALNVQRDRLAERATEVRTQLEDARQGSNVEQQLLIDLDSTLRRIADLDAQVAALETASVSPGLVITEAPQPRRPSSPDPVLLVASSAMLGLLAGLAAGGVRQLSRSQRVHDVAQLQRLDGVEHVLDLRGGAIGDHEGASAAARSGFERALAWRQRMSGTAHGGVLVTSVTTNPSQGLVAAGLAHAAAQRTSGGIVVVVVDSSSSILASGAPLVTLEEVDDTSESARLPSDRAAFVSAIAYDRPDTPEPLNADVVAAVARLAEHHALLVDAPPLEESSDAYAFWNCVDTVVIVVSNGDRTREAANGVSQIRSVMTVPIVAVLVDATN